LDLLVWTLIILYLDHFLKCNFWLFHAYLIAFLKLFSVGKFFSAFAYSLPWCFHYWFNFLHFTVQRNHSLVTFPNFSRFLLQFIFIKLHYGLIWVCITWSCILIFIPFFATIFCSLFHRHLFFYWLLVFLYLHIFVVTPFRSQRLMFTVEHC